MDQLARSCARTEIFDALNLADFDHLQKRLRRDQYIRERAMTLCGDREAESQRNDIQIVAELMWKERLAQAHGAEAFRQIDVSSAALFFLGEESHVEFRVVRDEQ